MTNFNQCPLVWMFSNSVSLKKIENLQKQALSFLQKSYNTSYEDLLLKSGFSSINVKRLRTLCVEIFRILNNLNPRLDRQTGQTSSGKYKLDLDILSYNQLTFGRKALTFLAQKIGIVSLIIQNLQKTLRHNNE